MRKRGQNKNRFFRIMTMPLKALVKARDLYMRSITGCAARTHYSSSSDVASVHFPRSRSTSSAFSSSSSTSSRRNFTFDDDYSELIRAASVRSLGHKSEIDMFIHQQFQQRQESRTAIMKGGLPKSSSVGMTMAKIDEEDEAEGSIKKNQKKGYGFLYPRSRSYAVTFRASKF